MDKLSRLASVLVVAAFGGLVLFGIYATFVKNITTQGTFGHVLTLLLPTLFCFGVFWWRDPITRLLEQGTARLDGLSTAQVLWLCLGLGITLRALVVLAH